MSGAQNGSIRDTTGDNSGYAHSSRCRGTGTIDVGSSRQLFIDDRFIAEVRDVALTM